MKHRSVLAVVVLTIITFGIYGIVWFVKTKEEMKSLGADIPTAWLLIIPFINIYWIYKYSMGAEKVTNGKMGGVVTFIILYFLSIVGMAILQSEFNNISGSPAAAPAAGTPLSGDSPVVSTAPVGPETAVEASPPSTENTSPAPEASSDPTTPDSTTPPSNI